jgi:ADP-ribose pyrophosphatase YjhB (NUDIX family)
MLLCWHTSRQKEAHLNVKVDDALWAAFCALGERYGMPAPDHFLEWCLRRIIQFEQVADGRYVPVSCAIVTRNEGKVLVVGNDYAAGRPLYWNLPGGAVDPGEDLSHAAIRELYEESGIEALQVGRLAWVVQAYNGPDRPCFLAFAFVVTAWQGEITLEHEEKGGSVRRAEFVSYAEACERLIPATAVPLHDWLTAPGDTPRMYWYDTRITPKRPRRIEMK